jgi:6-phospho-3-hexuloisomerase
MEQVMDFKVWSDFYLDHQRQNLAGINQAELESLADAIQTSERVFLLGKGRTGLVIEMFAMRLVHMGYAAYIIGQSITPKFMPKDLLILASCSGSTEGILLAARQALKAEGNVFAITGTPASPICSLAAAQIILSGSKEQSTEEQASKIERGTLFEQSLLLTLDCFIAVLAEKSGQYFAEMSRRHVKIE